MCAGGSLKTRDKVPGAATRNIRVINEVARELTSAPLGLVASAALTTRPSQRPTYIYRRLDWLSIHIYIAAYNAFASLLFSGFYKRQSLLPRRPDF